MAALQGCACEAMEVNSGGLTFEGLQLGKSCQNNSLLYVSSQSKTIIKSLLFYLQGQQLMF